MISWLNALSFVHDLFLQPVAHFLKGASNMFRRFSYTNINWELNSKAEDLSKECLGLIPNCLITKEFLEGLSMDRIEGLVYED